MIGVDTSRVHGIIEALFVLFAYWLSFWRIFKRNRGNKVVKCGSITLMLTVALGALLKTQAVPAWVLGSLGFLVFLLCLVTMLFLVQQGYRALRRRKTD